MSNFVNQLILGDNLEVLKTIPSEFVDLIYLDPPFFSNRNYEVIWGDKGEIRSFEDRWSGGIDHYIAWLKERVVEMHRVLKSTGSLFLHCDWHANAYIRVDILDRIFGYQNFVSDIIWERTTNSGSSKGIAKKFPNDHDTIYFFSKDSKKFKFFTQYRGYSDEYIRHYYIYNDNDGRGLYQVQALKTFSTERMEILLKENRIVEGKGKIPRFKDYLNDKKGVPINDIWTDIEPVNPVGKEKIGYPTQKPNALLERIINCTTNEGDLVLDPFIGGGTTCAVADKLQRNWIGIDQSVQAIKVSELRLNNQQDLFSKPFIVQLHKYEYDLLRYKEAFQFETWIVEQFGGMPNVKQRGDFGMDGKKGNTPIQVKRSDNIGRNVVDNFLSACKRYDKNLFEKNIAEGEPVGYIIAFTFGKGAIQEVARLHNQENVIIKLVTVEEIVPVAHRPMISVEIKDHGKDAKRFTEIEFLATGKSDIGIEFYAWDWDYDPQKGFKPEVLIDKHGYQKAKFKPGSYIIAVKVVDNEGFDNIEVIKLKVNGEVQRD